MQGLQTRAYAAEKMRSAYDALASIHGTTQERLAGAVWAMTVLDTFQEQFTDEGRRLYDKIQNLLGGGNLNERIASMSEYELIELHHSIRDLFYDTQSAYYDER